MAVCARKGRGGNGTPWTTFLLDLNLKASVLPSITCAIYGSVVPSYCSWSKFWTCSPQSSCSDLLKREKADGWCRVTAPALTLDQVWCGDGPRHTTELPASVINQGHSQGDLSGSWKLGTARLSLLICLTFQNSVPRLCAAQNSRVLVLY